MKQDLEELLADGRFSPFVISTHDGFSLAIGPEERRHILLGARMLVVVDSAGSFYHIPYSSISRIEEAKQ